MAFTALRTGFDCNQRSSSLIHRGLISGYTAGMAVFVWVNALDRVFESSESYLGYYLCNSGFFDPDTL